MPVALRRLAREDARAAHAHLAEQPERDVYLRGLVWKLGVSLPESTGRLLGWFVDDALRGIFLHSHVVVMSCDDERGVRAFAREVGADWARAPTGQLLSPRSTGVPFLEELAIARGPLPLRLLRDRMPVMRLRRGGLVDRAALPPPPDRWTRALVRPAEQREFGVLRAACRAVTMEELGIDPEVFDGPGFLGALRRRLRAGREFVWVDGGRLSFRAALSAATPEAVLVEGVYTPPELRGRRRGTWAMHELCRSLLERHGAVVLFVGEENERAIRLYERLGFEAFDHYQAAYFDTPELG
jgi:GNAT superfamily N-acetyltransferase